MQQSCCDTAALSALDKRRFKSPCPPLDTPLFPLRVQVRAKSLQELVYKNGQAGVTKATVSIVFDNTNKEGSPIGYADHDEITVTRQVGGADSLA